MYLLNFYVPKSHLEAVKEAIFAKGAGEFGDYKNCCWQTQGQGQFLPTQGSHPYTGERHELSTVSEFKVEMIIKDDSIKEVIMALKQAHPYEEVAYQVIPVVDV